MLLAGAVAAFVLWPKSREKSASATPKGIRAHPLCQRDVRQLSLDISVPMGGEWFLVRAQAFPDSRSFNSSPGERSQAA